MKRKYWYAIYAVALALLPVLLFFAIQLESPTDLLAPPGLTGDKLEIQRAFEASVPEKSGIILQYPTAGDYRSAYVLKDIDGDGQDEAIVFYTLKSDESTVRVNVLDRVGDVWKSVYDEPGYGAKVISIDFDDLNKDGHMELLTCWSIFETTTAKTLTIHSVTKDDAGVLELDALVNQSYTYRAVADMDSDGFNEVLVTWLDNTDQNLPKSYASLLKQAPDGTISQIGQNVSLDASVSAYHSLKLETTADGKSIAFLDAYKGDDAMITEVIWWDDTERALVAPLLDSDTLSNSLTLRSPAVPSMDIDKDGAMEIPIIANDGGAQVVKEVALPLFAWSTPVSDGLSPISYGFVNTTLGCYFEVPADFRDYMLAYRLSDDSCTTFYRSDDGEERAEPLFTFLVKKNADMNESDTYTFKVVHGGMAVYGTLTSVGEAMGFTNELIENSFTFFDTLT